MKETITKINRTKAGYLRRLTRIDKLLDRPMKKKKRRHNPIELENKEVTIDNTEMQRIIRKYYEQIYANITEKWKK